MDKFPRSILAAALAVVVFLAASCQVDSTAQLEASQARRALFVQRGEALDDLVTDAAGITEVKRLEILNANKDVGKDYHDIADEQDQGIQAAGKLDFRTLWEKAKERLSSRDGN